MAWILSARLDACPAGAIEAGTLIQEIRAVDSVAAIEHLSITVGNVRVELADLVRIEHTDTEPETIRLIGDFSRWNALGFCLEHGRLVIEGHAGHRTAAELAGGSVEVRGNCGVWAGAAARRGRLVIHGDAGDWLGANWPGEIRGMTGGEILVHGRAGDHVGVRMRRGLVAVGGEVGEGLGRAMIAGSIFVGGSVRSHVGIGMKRGTIVLKASAENQRALAVTGFGQADAFRPLTLDMQLRYARDAGWHEADSLLDARTTRRYLGDKLSLGLGEVFLLSSSNA
jgi:formylmethanofuran dehydrogenase subunit C